MTNLAKLTVTSRAASMKGVVAGTLAATMLAAGLPLAAASPAAAGACLRLASGVMLCIGQNGAPGGRVAPRPAPRPMPVRQPSVERMIQVIKVTSLWGSSSIVESYKPNAARSHAITRVCMANYGNHTRSFRHTVPNINPLTAAGGGAQSCANFPSSRRLRFTLMDGGSVARASRNMVMSLSAFAGGIVRFTWQ